MIQGDSSIKKVPQDDGEDTEEAKVDIETIKGETKWKNM